MHIIYMIMVFAVTSRLSRLVQITNLLYALFYVDQLLQRIPRRRPVQLHVREPGGHRQRPVSAGGSMSIPMPKI